MVDGMDGCVVMDGGWVDEVGEGVDECIEEMNECVRVRGGKDDVWSMDCELFCAVERKAVR